MTLKQITIGCAASLILGMTSFCVLGAVADMHATKGMSCESCHAEKQTPSSDTVKPDVCMGCHGETPIAPKQSFLGKELNIHASHFDTYECALCHKAHTSSVLACNDCHQFKGIKVP